MNIAADPIPCSRWYSLDKCVSHGCRWADDASECLAEDEQVRCPPLVTESQCTLFGHCGTCFALRPVVARLHHITWFTQLTTSAWEQDYRACYNKNAGLACHIHFQEKCDHDSKCKWNAAAERCFSADKPVPCDAYFRNFSCLADQRCEWSELAMVCIRKGV